MLFDVGMANTRQHHLIAFIRQEAITRTTPRLPSMILQPALWASHSTLAVWRNRGVSSSFEGARSEEQAA